MKERYDTYCGLYCGSCEVFLANRKGLVDELAREWEMNPADLRCNGCKDELVATFCRSCKIKGCAEDKGIGFCFQCADYPCKILSDFKNDHRPHHSIVLYNLALIKDNGLNKWLKEQEIRWSCPGCGEKYSWYDESCLNCNSVLKNCLDDEKELED